MEGNWTDVGVFQQQWPKPDAELAEFLRKVQPSRIELLLSPQEPVQLTPDITYILHFPIPGNFEIIVPFPKKPIAFDVQNPAKRVAVYRAYAHQPEITIDENGTKATYQRMLYITALGSKSSYREALRLFGIAPREIQDQNGMMEQAKKFKEIYDSKPDDGLALIMACPAELE